ncbi:DddA-like double-stranded DNA deaminase toxin [Amycolatopsis sp. A1MSW2902]|uniref:DddA-like double-stranded DNA deaminase toxin n=1 Tax=Amycolatopsis sp. A1MSW2902 TaxID=687413 RepID=UPI00307DF9EC
MNGRVLPAVTSGGANDPLTHRAKDLLREHGYTDRQADFLKYHAEIKVVALMRMNPAIGDVEIAINNTPCGVEEFADFTTVCTKALDRLLPAVGSQSLTIYGSYQDNRPYTKRYGRPR